MSIPKLSVIAALLVTACGNDTVEIIPQCDEIGWPLGVDPLVRLPTPEFAVECADGWGNNIDTRPANETVTLPGSSWAALDPAGGSIHVTHPHEYQPGWPAFLEQAGVDTQCDFGGPRVAAGRARRQPRLGRAGVLSVGRRVRGRSAVGDWLRL